jgi:hypothetical protein
MFTGIEVVRFEKRPKNLEEVFKDPTAWSDLDPNALVETVVLFPVPLDLCGLPGAEGF